MSAVTCEWCRSLAPELALGVAPGRERAVALAHIEGCARCRAALVEHTSVVEALLGAGPVTEPPVGFETNVLDQLGSATSMATGAGRSSARSPTRSDRPETSPADAGRRAAPPHYRRAALAAAAVLLAVVVGLSFDRWDRARAPQGVTGTPPGSVSGGAPSAVTGVLRGPGGRALGRVVVRRGESSELVVELNGGVRAGSYRVQCDYQVGPTYGAGLLTVGAGPTEPWRATVPVPTYDLRRVRLVSTSGGPNLEAEIGS